MVLSSPDVSKAACDARARELAKQRETIKGCAVLAVGALVVASCIGLLMDPDDDSDGPTVEDAIAGMRLRHNFEQGPLWRGTFTIENSNDMTITDVHVRCRFYAASGTQVDSSNFPYYQRFAPQQTREVDVAPFAVHGQAVRSSCEVYKLEISSRPGHPTR